MSGAALFAFVFGGSLAVFGLIAATLEWISCKRFSSTPAIRDRVAAVGEGGLEPQPGRVVMLGEGELYDADTRITFPSGDLTETRIREIVREEIKRSAEAQRREDRRLCR